MKTVIIVQARMTSTRLPGKILKPVLGKPLLEYQIDRLVRVNLANEVVVATTVNDADQPIVDLCVSKGIPFFRGSEEDVLSRYHGAAVCHKADVVVRVTSDCPLIDPAVIDRVIEHYLNSYPRLGYVSNCLTRTFPRGMDTEVFSFQALDAAFTEATAQPDHEHVTPFIWMRPERFPQGNVVYQHDYSRYRWTVDTPEDLELITRMITALYPANPNFTLEDCLELLQANPDWEFINSHIEQKKYGQ